MSAFTVGEPDIDAELPTIDEVPYRELGVAPGQDQVQSAVVILPHAAPVIAMLPPRVASALMLSVVGLTVVVQELTEHAPVTVIVVEVEQVTDGVPVRVAVTVAVYVPGVEYVWDGAAPVPMPPSPKTQAYVTAEEEQLDGIAEATKLTANDAGPDDGVAVIAPQVKAQAAE